MRARRDDDTECVVKTEIIFTLVTTAVFLVVLVVVLDATTVEKASLEESAEASMVRSRSGVLLWGDSITDHRSPKPNASFRVSGGCPFSFWGRRLSRVWVNCMGG